MLVNNVGGWPGKDGTGKLIGVLRLDLIGVLRLILDFDRGFDFVFGFDRGFEIGFDRGFEIVFRFDRVLKLILDLFYLMPIQR